MKIARKAKALLARALSIVTKDPAIILYHRVGAPKRDPWGLAVSEENFNAQLRQLRRTRTCLPLDDFLRDLRFGKLRPDAVAVAFDDGYRDNYDVAWPILRDLDVPATIFLATGPMLRGTPYWWDELAHMILDAPTGSNEALAVGGCTIRLEFADQEDADLDGGDWRAWDTPRTTRQATYAQLWEALRILDAEQRSTVMDDLRIRLPVSFDQDGGPMSVDEVARLTASDLVTLGGHTHDHSDLPALSAAAALRDIERGKAEVEALSGRRAIVFAYPYGRFNARVRQLVREAGFEWACTTCHACIGRQDIDPLLLPRVTAPNQPHILTG